MHPSVLCSTVYNGQDMETAYYSAIKKNEIRPFAATWMDLESVILNEVHQAGKEKSRMTPPYTLNLIRYLANVLTIQRLTDLENELMFAGLGVVQEGIVKDFGKVSYTLLCLKWITNKNLLYSMWNSAQCYEPGWTGEMFGGERIHVYVWLSPYIVYLRLSQRC